VRFREQVSALYAPQRWAILSIYTYIYVPYTYTLYIYILYRTRRRSDLKYLDLQIIRFPHIIRGLPFSSVKTSLNFWGLLWELVWKLRGFPWKFIEILEVVIIWIPISSVCGVYIYMWWGFVSKLALCKHLRGEQRCIYIYMFTYIIHIIYIHIFKYVYIYIYIYI